MRGNPARVRTRLLPIDQVQEGEIYMARTKRLTALEQAIANIDQEIGALEHARKKLVAQLPKPKEETPAPPTNVTD